MMHLIRSLTSPASSSFSLSMTTLFTLTESSSSDEEEMEMEDSKIDRLCSSYSSRIFMSGFSLGRIWYSTYRIFSWGSLEVRLEDFRSTELCFYKLSTRSVLLAFFYFLTSFGFTSTLASALRLCVLAVSASIRCSTSLSVSRFRFMEVSMRWWRSDLQCSYWSGV